ncbi:GIY-YIG nuclease family protein [Pantoea sp. UBA6567]|uniref:GIY-YIG nuclease family protein n=1 Tax=Pantoea sp. UBA6567 TaxID=1947043 RepID=UPI0032E3E58A
MIAKIPAQRDLETELHQKYGGFRAHGEWFCLMKEHLSELASDPGNLIANK